MNQNNRNDLKLRPRVSARPWKLLVAATLLIAASAALSSAQPAQERPEQASPPPTSQTNQMDMRTMQHMEEMDAMAKSMKSMADVCRMMMEKEMRSYPIKLAAIIGVGTLLFAALVLFVILEIQWIRFWSVRIRTERLKLAGTKPS